MGDLKLLIYMKNAGVLEINIAKLIKTFILKLGDFTVLWGADGKVFDIVLHVTSVFNKG